MQIVNPFTAIYKKLNSYQNELDAFEFPICIDVELTNCCNLKCYMCPTGIGSSIREKGYMSDKTYYKLLRDISGHQVGLRFIRWGEPTLHPKMCKYIKAAKKEGHLCHINTNGVTINKLIDDILEAGLDSVKFSFQGVNEESYERIRQGGNFKNVIANIKDLYNARINNSPYIQVSTTTTSESEEEIKKFKESIAPYCDMINVGATILQYLDIDRSDMNEKQKELFQKIKSEQRVVYKRPAHCSEVYGKLSVDWDGKISACCTDYDRELIIGDLADNTISEIFMCNKIDTYRKILSRKAFSEVAKCSKCFDYILAQPV